MQEERTVDAATALQWKVRLIEILCSGLPDDAKIGDHWSDEEADAMVWRAAEEIGLDVERLTEADRIAMIEAD